MAEAVQRDRWNRTAMVCGVVANSNRGPNQPMIDLRAFHPMEKASGGSNGIEVDADTVRIVAKSVAAKRDEY